MKIKKYTELPKEAIQIRNEVFVEEQGFIDEFDSIDNISTHLVLFRGDLPLATCRYYWNKEKNAYYIGRIAVVKDYRGKGLGRQILREAETQITNLGGSIVYLSAQLEADRFYKNQGYVTTGDIYYDEDCPHICMYKKLGKLHI